MNWTIRMNVRVQKILNCINVDKGVIKMKNKVDEIFIRLAELFRTIKDDGLMPVKLLDVKDAVDEFYNKALSMMLDGRVAEHMDLVLSFELAKSIRDNKLNDDDIKCMILIKKLIEPIMNLEYDNIVQFSKIWASKEVYHKINDEILWKYVKSDFENSQSQIVCESKFYDTIEIED